MLPTPPWHPIEAKDVIGHTVRKGKDNVYRTLRPRDADARGLSDWTLPYSDTSEVGADAGPVEARSGNGGRYQVSQL